MKTQKKKYPPRRPAQHEVSTPRPSAEAVRNPHTVPTARTRHAPGNAAQRDEPGADVERDAGGDWLAERVAPAGRG